jgi:c-di-GMP-binding flagellar brake protein YcgR
VTDRVDPRHAVVVPLFVSYGDRVYQKQIELRSKDLSGGGLSFETRSKIPTEASTRVVVSRLGDLSSDARIEGRVVYRQKNQVTGKYVVGIAFTRFVNVSREELERHIARWSTSERQLTPI